MFRFAIVLAEARQHDPIWPFARARHPQDRGEGHVTLIQTLVQDPVVTSRDPVPAETPDLGYDALPKCPRAIHVVNAKAVTGRASDQRLVCLGAKFLILLLELFDIQRQSLPRRRVVAHHAADDGRMIQKRVTARDDGNALLLEDIDHLPCERCVPNDRVEIVLFQAQRDGAHIIRFRPRRLVPRAHRNDRGIECAGLGR